MSTTPAPTAHDHLTECLTFGTRTQRAMLRRYLALRGVDATDFVAGTYAPLTPADLDALLATVRRATRKPL